jgi:phosphoribosylaminoimidazole-succinocarboxamide synthase
LVNQNGFQGLEGQQIPDMTEEYIETVSERYIELYEKILGEVRESRHFKYQ